MINIDRKELRVAVDALPAYPGKSGAVGLFRNLLQIAPEVDDSVDLTFFVSPSQHAYYARYLDSRFSDRIRFQTVNFSESSRLGRLVAQNLLVPRACQQLGLNAHFSLNPEPLFDMPGMVEVFKVADLQFIEVPQEFGIWKTCYRNYMGKRKVSRSELIIANSQYTQQRIIDSYNIEADRVQVVYEGVDHQIYFPEIDRSIPSAKIAEKYGVVYPFIIYQSSFRPYKNHLALLKAFQMLITKYNVPHHLLLVGININNYRQIIEHAINEGNLNSRIHCLDFVSDEDLRYFYNTATCSVYPSTLETFGIPPLEAMACGIPVIISNQTCLPEVTGGGADIVDPENIDQFCEAMNRVLTDTSYAKKLATRGLDWCQQYTWQRSISETINLMKSIV